jgi:Dienelactone hydrolase family
MIEEGLEIATKDGALPTLLRRLERGHHPGVLFLMDAAGSPGEVEIYAGVHHGFAFPQRKIYDRAAAERHWERLIALYRRRLG